MLHSKFWLPLLGFLAPLLPLQAQTGHNIKVTVKDFASDKLVLAYHYGSKQYIADTVTSTNNTFVFSGDKPLSKGIYLVVLPPKNNYFELMMNDDQTMEISTDTVDLSGHIKVTGCRENELFYEDLQFLAKQRKLMEELSAKEKAAEGAAAKESLKAEMDKINKDVVSYREEFVKNNPTFLYAKVLKAMRDPEVPERNDITDPKEKQLFQYTYYKSHYWDGVNFGDTTLLRTPALEQRMDYYMDKLTVQHPDSIVESIDYLVAKSRAAKPMFKYFVITLLNKYANSKIMCMDRIYVWMVEKYYLNKEADWTDDETLKKMQERVYFLKPCLCGEVAKNFTMQDTAGVWHDMNKYAARNKLTLLYFFDYDCGHCKKATPLLAEKYDKYKNKGVGLYTVNINGTREEWQKHLREYKFTGGVHTADPKRETHFDQYYDIHSTPRMFILDKDKKIIAKQIGVEQLEEVLDNMLKEIEEQEKSKGKFQD